MQRSITYRFEYPVACEMCGEGSEKHRILGQRLNTSQGLKPKSKTGISVSVKKCNNCGLIYPSPIPIPENIQDHYGILPETYWKPSYFEPDHNYFLKEIDILKQLIEIHPYSKALDIGAGIGKAMLALNNAGFDTYGFEPSRSFYERAVSKMGIHPSRIKLATVEEMEYDENSFDFITFGAVLEHLYHPANCIEKALKWLKPEGVIHIEVPSSDHLVAKVINFYYKILGTNYVTNLSPMHEPFHLYEFSLKSFQFLAKRLNFDTIFSEYQVCNIYSIPKVFHSILRSYMERTNKGMQLIVWLKKITL